MVAEARPAARCLPDTGANGEKLVQTKPKTHSGLPEVAAEYVGKAGDDRRTVAAIDVDTVTDATAQPLNKMSAVEIGKAVMRAAAARTIISDDGGPERIDSLRDQCRRHISRRRTLGPAARVVQNIGPGKPRVQRRLAPRGGRHSEHGVEPVTRSIEPVPGVVRAEPVLPVPRHIANGDIPVRGRRVNQFERHCSGRAVDKIDRPRLDMMLNSHFHERHAGIGGAQRYHDRDLISFRRGDSVNCRRIFRVDGDETTPLRDVDGLTGIPADVQGIVYRSTGIVVERNCFDRDHGTLPPIAPDKAYWRFSDKERAAQPTPGGPRFCSAVIDSSACAAD